MRPLATLDAAEGGSGTLKMWTVDNTSFASTWDATAADVNLTYGQKSCR